MKNVFITLIFMLSMSAFAQQLPNASFENWNTSIASTQEPTDWFSMNVITTGYPSYGTLQSSDSYDGLSALRLVSGKIAVPAYSLDDTSAVVILGTLDYLSGQTKPGFPFTYRPEKYSFYYKYTPGSVPAGKVDTGLVFVKFTKAGVNVGGAQWKCYGGAVTQYTKIEVPIEWWSLDTPDSVFVNFTSSEIGMGQSFNVSTRFANVIGNELLIDKFEFIYAATGIETASTGSKLLTYPNPATDVLHVCSESTLGNYTIIDMQGNKVASGKCIDKSIPVSSLPIGYYNLQLQVGEEVQFTKFLKK